MNPSDPGAIVVGALIRTTPSLDVIEIVTVTGLAPTLTTLHASESPNGTNTIEVFRVVRAKAGADSITNPIAAISLFICRSSFALIGHKSLRYRPNALDEPPSIGASAAIRTRDPGIRNSILRLMCRETWE
jgi:hypothetical protein